MTTSVFRTEQLLSKKLIARNRFLLNFHLGVKSDSLTKEDFTLKNYVRSKGHVQNSKPFINGLVRDVLLHHPCLLMVNLKLV